MSRRRKENRSPDNRSRGEPKNRSRLSADKPAAIAPSPFAAKTWLFAAALIIAVFLAYQSAWQGGFIWDDDDHLLNNPVLKPGGLLQTWVPGSYLNYWPLTFTVYRLEFEMWGLNPLGFHLVNIALHAVSALLVWRILEHLRMPGALLAAAIFALHPVNVESVAWITQLKNTLSLTLTLVSVLFYFLYERDGGRWRFAMSVGLFLLAALAKGMALTLPIVLLACAWWQRGAIGRRDVLRMLPFLLIGALMVGMEVTQQHAVAGTSVVRCDGFFSRTAIAGCAVWFYFWKLIWPANLVFIYPQWNINERDIWAYLPGVLLVAILALAWWRRRSWGRPLLMAMACYVALLLPVLGFVNIYFMEYSLVADHWQYAAMIVPCAALAAALVTLGRRLSWPRPAGYAACLVLLATLGCLTWRQSGMYTDSEKLFRATIKGNPACWMAHNNLAMLLANDGRTDEAIFHTRIALGIHPDDAPAENNLGATLARRGQIDEAIVHFRQAVKIKPDYAQAHESLARALAMRGLNDEVNEHLQLARLLRALAERRELLQSRPDDVALLSETAWALATNPNKSIRNGTEAVELARRAVRVSDGRQPAVLGALAAAYAEAGQFADAVQTAEQALALATSENKVALADALRAQIKLYRAESPYREMQQRAISK
jgi:tetratricopeptide (TPR) repeat protein